MEQVIADTIDYIAAHWRDQPDLAFLAARAGYDPTHFQKNFTRMVGLSPKKLCQYMNARHARDLLLRGYPTLDAAYAAGLSGNGRLFDLFVNVEAATPSEVKAQGRGLCIHHGFHPTPLGDMLIAQTDRGICWLGFVVDGDHTEPLRRLRAYWPLADMMEDRDITAPSARRIMGAWRGGVGGEDARLALHLFGTNFQIQVWQALLKIPSGAAVSYRDIAEHIGKPAASRAVGGAVGANPVSLLIPCHRVLRQSGIIENYGWGTARKTLILALEADGGRAR